MKKDLMDSLHLLRKDIAKNLGVEVDSIRFDSRCSLELEEFFIRLEHVFKIKGREWFFIPNENFEKIAPIRFIKNGNFERVELFVLFGEKGES